MKNKNNSEYFLGLVKFLSYVLTKSPQDIGLLHTSERHSAVRIMRIPASIFCYWMGESEILRKSILTNESD